MDASLTPREQQIMELITKSIETNGYPPSVREIGQAVGLLSSSTVHNYLKRLEVKGYLRRDPTKPRAMEILGPENQGRRRQVRFVPILGRVAAGTPLLAVENQEGAFPLPTDFAGGELFMLTVRGDSMIDAGIANGDLVIVRRQATADNGDIVVALLDSEATVKRFFKEAAHVRLQPENRAMSPILTREVRILGKVIGLLHRF